MSQPVSYNPTILFAQEEASAVAGRSTVRTPAIDAEFAALALTISQTLANLAVIQRDDTGLRDLVVTTQSLSANVKALFANGVTPRGAWLTATSYAVKDVVETGTPFVSYICVIAHTSGTFATDRTAGKWMVLGQEPGSIVITDLTLTTGGFALGTNNTQDLAATANRFRSGYFGTSVFAATSVVTPLVGNVADVNLVFQVAAQPRWIIDTNIRFRPQTDATQDIGDNTHRILNVFATIIDSGATGSLSLKTNNGTTGFVVDHVGLAVNNFHVQGDISGGNGPFLISKGTDANVNSQYGAKGTGSHRFTTDALISNVTQFQILHTATSTRNITITGSNGGNPTISTTAGSLAITPAVVLTGGISGVITGTSASASALAIGANGATNPVLQIDASVVSVATGVKITGSAAGSNVFIAAISSGANEQISLDGKGSGAVVLGNLSTGIIKLGLQNADIRWGKPLVALGGGAAPTFGTIGGSGPAVAGQNTWLRILDSSDIACWVPVWK